MRRSSGPRSTPPAKDAAPNSVVEAVVREALASKGKENRPRRFRDEDDEDEGWGGNRGKQNALGTSWGRGTKASVSQDQDIVGDAQRETARLRRALENSCARERVLLRDNAAMQADLEECREKLGKTSKRAKDAAEAKSALEVKVRAKEFANEKLQRELDGAKELLRDSKREARAHVASLRHRLAQLEEHVALKAIQVRAPLQSLQRSAHQLRAVVHAQQAYGGGEETAASAALWYSLLGELEESIAQIDGTVAGSPQAARPRTPSSPTGSEEARPARRAAAGRRASLSASPSGHTHRAAPTYQGRKRASLPESPEKASTASPESRRSLDLVREVQEGRGGQPRLMSRESSDDEDMDRSGLGADSSPALLEAERRELALEAMLEERERELVAAKRQGLAYKQELQHLLTANAPALKQSETLDALLLQEVAQSERYRAAHAQVSEAAAHPSSQPSTQATQPPWQAALPSSQTLVGTREAEEAPRDPASEYAGKIGAGAQQSSDGAGRGAAAGEQMTLSLQLPHEGLADGPWGGGGGADAGEGGNGGEAEAERLLREEEELAALLGALEHGLKTRERPDTPGTAVSNGEPPRAPAQAHAPPPPAPAQRAARKVFADRRSATEFFSPAKRASPPKADGTHVSPLAAKGRATAVTKRSPPKQASAPQRRGPSPPSKPSQKRPSAALLPEPGSPVAAPPRAARLPTSAHDVSTHLAPPRANRGSDQSASAARHEAQRPLGRMHAVGESADDVLCRVKCLIPIRGSGGAVSRGSYQEELTLLDTEMEELQRSLEKAAQWLS